MSSGAARIYYSDHYYDSKYEYRHVIIPADLVARVPKDHLMSEMEWRRLGLQMSSGWEHYERYKPEPHVLLFRRPLTSDHAFQPPVFD